MGQTPDETIEQVIAHTICTLNPRGSACCFWHHALKQLQWNISQMLSGTCDNHVDCRPHDSWQCAFCFSLQDDDEEDDRFCSLCGFQSNLRLKPTMRSS